jgi:hypothetical protein
MIVMLILDQVDARCAWLKPNTTHHQHNHISHHRRRVRG